MSLCVFQRCHNYMTEQLGIPVWGSYVIFGLATLFSGLALGLVRISAALPSVLLLLLLFSKDGTEVNALTTFLIILVCTTDGFCCVVAAASGLYRRFCLPVSTLLSSGIPPE